MEIREKSAERCGGCVLGGEAEGAMLWERERTQSLKGQGTHKARIRHARARKGTRWPNLTLPSVLCAWLASP